MKGFKVGLEMGPGDIKAANAVPWIHYTIYYSQFSDSARTSTTIQCHSTQEMAATTGHYIGQRLSFSSALCTVRYIGTVLGTKGEWLGVEWDDPRRGKHGGEHDGVRYFECKI